ncbi:MAG: MarR family transcriptional regulator [Saprospiraceae bacterium]|nr:MarR family transcriptional regulator [Saprospiraceae bacterium]MDZ4706116.1 MarR family transcriptional regulator [Saprospiraceae bacterium]
MKIEDAIQQKQFISEFQKAHINVLYTASFLNQKTLKALKPFQISPQQFNILRILRGQHPQPASVKLLTEKMIDKTSNASRLVEKLRSKGLVAREASDDDRRKVDVEITNTGLELLEQASVVIEQMIQNYGASITPEEAGVLNGLLDKVRRK